MFLIIWDKIFGTFCVEDPVEPVLFGTVKNVEYRNCMDIIFNEYAAIIKDTKQDISFKEKIQYIFGPQVTAIMEAAKQPAKCKRITRIN